MDELFVHLARVGLVLAGGLRELETKDLGAPLPKTALGSEERGRALIWDDGGRTRTRSWTRIWSRSYGLGTDQGERSEDEQAKNTGGKPPLFGNTPSSPWNGDGFQGDEGIIL